MNTNEPEPDGERRPRMHGEARIRHGRIRDALWWAAAVDARVMAHPDCSADWNRYAIMGGAVLATALIAAVYGTVMVYSYYVPVLMVALAAGVFWGAVILNADRFMLATLIKPPHGGLGKLMMLATPRLGLALLVAGAISVPAELMIFERRIDVQLQIDQQNEVAAQQQRLDRKYHDITRLDALEKTLEAEIIDREQAAAAQFAEAAREGDGTGGSGRSGRGFRYEAKLVRYQELSSEAERAAQANRSRIAELRRDREALELRRDREIASFRRVADDADDLLARLIALHRLESDEEIGRVVWATGWVIRLIAILIELLPFGGKLFGRRGPYEAALLAVQERQRARWDARREDALLGAELMVELGRKMGASVQHTTEWLVETAVGDAMGSEEALEEQRRLMREILDESVAVSRRAAASVFGTDELERELAAAAREHREAADERAVRAEADRADVYGGFRRAISHLRILRTDRPKGGWRWTRRNGREGSAGTVL